MTHPTGALPNETYVEALRQADAAGLRQIYTEFRAPIVRAINLAGGSTADGARLFQAAVIEAARQAQAGALDEEAPIFLQLKAWATDEYRLTAGYAAEPTAAADRLETPEIQPLQSALARMAAWKADEGTSDEAGYAVWKITEELEHRLVASGAAEKVATREPALNRGWRYLLITLATATLGYALYTWFSRPQPPGELFADHFQPPESFLADRALRYSAQPDSLSGGAPLAECERLLGEADRLYQAGQLEEAQEPLLLVVLDSTSACQSDGWYYLSLLRLQLEDPVTAVECLTKIEDLDRYAQDIQWHMALAFVQMAEQQPSLRDKARRALEKVLTSGQSEDRQAHARAMLEALPQ